LRIGQHVSIIIRKLGVTNRVKAAAIAVDHRRTGP
jgi:DNA-binding NarL/FixJ family response regulator